jgi:hypothetical protein
MKDNLDVWREEVSMRGEGGTKALGAERHPVGLHVPRGVAALLTDVLVDVGLQDVVPEFYSFICIEWCRNPGQLERHESMAKSETKFTVVNQVLVKKNYGNMKCRFLQQQKITETFSYF